jgi:hypothetical protein
MRHGASADTQALRPPRKVLLTGRTEPPAWAITAVGVRGLRSAIYSAKRANKASTNNAAPLAGWGRIYLIGFVFDSLYYGS